MDTYVRKNIQQESCYVEYQVLEWPQNHWIIHENTVSYSQNTNLDKLIGLNTIRLITTT